MTHCVAMSLDAGTIFASDSRTHPGLYASDSWFQMTHDQWSEGLRRVFAELPSPQR